MASSVYTQSGISVRSPGQTYCRSNSTAPSLAPLRAALVPTPSPLIASSAVPAQRDVGCDPRIWPVYGVLHCCQGSRASRLDRGSRAPPRVHRAIRRMDLRGRAKSAEDAPPATTTEASMTIRQIATCVGLAALAGAMLATSGQPVQALTMKECSAKYQAAKTAGTLGGQNWRDFRKAQCGADATAAAPAATPAAAPAAAP